MVQTNETPQLSIEEVSDPSQIARHRMQDERQAKNLKWLESHWGDLPGVRGHYVVVADQQAFIAETAEVAWNWARTQHPADDGAVVLRVPAEKGWKIYANCR